MNQEHIPLALTKKPWLNLTPKLVDDPRTLLIVAMAWFLFPGLTWPVFAETPTDLSAIARRTGVSLESRVGPLSFEAQEQLGALLAEPLNQEGAVRVALLNSHRIQALLHEARIARAEWLAARSFPNPEIEASTRRGDENHAEFAVLFDVSRLVFHPLKKGLANSISRAAKLRLAAAFLDEITQVRTAFIVLQGLLHVREVLKSSMDAADAMAELATRQRKAGNVSRLEQSLQQSLRQETQLVGLRSDAAILAARERLAGLLGLAPSAFSIQAELTEIPPGEPDLEHLEKRALAQRPDVMAAREEEQAAGKALKLARLEIFPKMAAGVVTEKDQDGRKLSGPMVSMEIPVFDFGYPARARAKARRDQTHHLAAGLETQVLSEVRAAHGRLVATKAIEVHLRESVIPLRTQMLENALKHYNFMLTGVFQLLEAKRAEIEAMRELLEARRDYWLARVELDQASGWGLMTEEEAVSAEAEGTGSSPNKIRDHHLPKANNIKGSQP